MNDVFPIECPKSKLESLGFVFGDKADEIFYNVNFPKGWSKQAADHSIWTYLCDDKGRIRGSIGYKAAVYDRWAYCILNCRYHVCIADYVDRAKRQHCVKDRGNENKVLFLSGIEFGNMFDDDSRESERECINWLNDNFPNWEDVLAYWD